MKLTKADILGHAVDGIHAKLEEIKEEYGINSKEHKELDKQYTDLYKQYQKEYISEMVN